MELKQFETILYDMYQMDFCFPPSMFKWKSAFEKESYSQWAIEEVKQHIKKSLYPRTSGTIDEFIYILRGFVRKMSKYSHIGNPRARVIFSIAVGVAVNIEDLLRAMK